MGRPLFLGMPLHRAAGLLRHWTTAKDRHGVHSPFVYTLVEQVLRPTERPVGTDDIEVLRDQFLGDQRSITVTDLGAGSHRMRSPQRRVRDIARHALCGPKEAGQLHRLARFLNARHVVELGTSLGITTLYLARSVPHGRVTTMEGCPATLAIAQELLTRAGQTNITIMAGDFRHTLPATLAQLPQLDLAFIDGHHAEEPTLEYFNQCMAKAHDHTVIVLDDIHWSPGMERAWKAVKADPRVTVTIDLYRMGLVFLRREQAREHFVLRY